MKEEKEKSLRDLAQERISHYYPQGLSSQFPSMTNKYKWSKVKPNVPDSRIPIKSGAESHGLERLAWQYHVQSFYKDASDHWLMAAYSRNELMESLPQLINDGHMEAVSYAVKNYLYNKALHEWQENYQGQSAPEPEVFGLNKSDITNKTLEAKAILKEREGQVVSTYNI